MELDKNTLYRLWAVIAFGAGNRIIHEISDAFGSAEEMYLSLTDKDSPYRRQLPSNLIAKIDSAPFSMAEQTAEYCEKKGIHIVTEDDKLYPTRLMSVYAPPSLLFYKGDISGIDDSISIGIVGTRKPSDYSIKVTKALTRSLVKNEVSIVSGFAVGIDICAHTTAAGCGGKTYAVLGSGIDYNYPPENDRYRSLIEENGAFISEYLPAAKPTANSFPQRNRILSGLSMGVAVMEAGERSGSLNTAGQALSQGRDIFVIPPHDLFDVRYGGNVKLLRDGAVPLFGARDILGEYTENYPTASQDGNAKRELESLKAYPHPAEAVKPTASPAHKTVSRGDNYSESRPDLSALSGDALTVAETIFNSGNLMRADDLSSALDMPVDDILMILTELEIEGVAAAANGCYRIIS